MSNLTLESILGTGSSMIARDLRLNFNRIMEDGKVAREDFWFTVLALSQSLHWSEFTQVAKETLTGLGQSPEHIQEAQEFAGLVNMLNTYYKFRFMVKKDDEYRGANLRMTALAKPQLGKLRSELIALGISILNGCETCIRAHEEEVRKHGAESDMIHDVARLAAVIKGLDGLLR